MATTRVVVALVAILLLAPRGVGQDPLVAAATAREKATQSVDVRFHVTELVAKGSYSPLAAAEVAKTGSTTIKLSPPQDITLESDNRLVLDGSKVRSEFNHPRVRIPGGAVPKKPTLTTVNGEVARTLFPNGIGSESKPSGIISPGPRSPGLAHYLFTPLMMHFRGTNPDLVPYPIPSLKNSERTERIGTRTCRCYTKEISKDRIAEFWFDTENYDLIRIRKLKGGVPYEECEIEYQSIPNAGSALKSWVRTDYTDEGKIRTRATVTVTDIAINNPPDASAFEVVFPPGCKVHDQRVRKEFLVTENGEFQELEITGVETSSTIAQPGSSWFQRNRWLSIGWLVTLLVVCTWIVWRWRSRTTAALSS